MTYVKVRVSKCASHGCTAQECCARNLLALLRIKYICAQILRLETADHEVYQRVVDVCSGVEKVTNAQDIDAAMQLGGVIPEVAKEASAVRAP